MSDSVRLRFLDGLRGWAALSVVIYHFLFAFLPYISNLSGPNRGLGESFVHGSWLYACISGGYAVTIFFTLSGVVLSSAYFRRGQTEQVQASAIKRYVRLGVPAGVSALAAYVFMKLGLFSNAPAANMSGSSWWGSFWAFPAEWYDAIAHGFFGVYMHGAGSDTYNPVMWTMQVELWGSFLVYLILLAFGAYRRRWVFYILLAALLWQTHYVCFVAGVAIADWYFGGHHERLPRLARRLAWPLLLMLGIGLGATPDGPVSQTMYAWIEHMPFERKYLQTFLYAAAAAATLLAVMLSPALQWLLTRRLSVFLGRISFSLYLTHFIVLGVYSSYLFTVLDPGLPYAARLGIAFIASMGAIIPVAYLYTRWVDEPAIRLSGLIHKRWFAGDAGGAQAATPASTK